MHFFLVAQQGQTASGGEPPWFQWLVLWLPLLVVFYFLIILPMRRQEKQRKALIGSLKKNDKIINSGGIIGIVESVKSPEDEVVLRGGLRVTLSSIVKVVTDETG